MKFTKMQASGNDYIYINCFEEGCSFDPASLSQKLSDRHFGIGSDGLILIQPSECADIKMDIYNADGSRAQMCGNGLRCLVKYAYERGLIGSREITVETLAGIRRAELTVMDGKVSAVCVDMGVPELRPEKIPVAADGPDFIRRKLSVLGSELTVTALSMGNPHCVVFCDSLAAVMFELLGPAIERHSLFPERTNVEFAEVRPDGRILVRVWERGSGETLACGTGASAVLAAGVLEGRCGSAAVIVLRGGELKARWAGGNKSVYLTGGAEFVFDGAI